MAAALAQQVVQQMAIGQTAEELASLDQQACPVCGITFFEFRSQGRLGCPHDYTAFKTQLEPLILNIHGEGEHVGKRPRRSPAGSEKRTQLIRLRREMKEAIETRITSGPRELRDEIRGIEKENVVKRARQRRGWRAVELNDLARNSGEWLRGTGPEADIVISSRIRLARNLADFPFISRATPQDRAADREDDARVRPRVNRSRRAALRGRQRVGGRRPPVPRRAASDQPRARREPGPRAVAIDRPKSSA